MTVKELATMVRDMRQAQAAYFKHRDNGRLETSKRLERELDRAVESVLAGPSLFDKEGA